MSGPAENPSREIPKLIPGGDGVKKVLKWIGIVLGGLVLLVVIVAGGMILSTTLKLNKIYHITPEVVTVPTDAASIQYGHRLVISMCVGCHHDNLAGGEFFDDPAIGTIDSANLTAGKGGIGASFTDADWVLAIRHGVRDDGQSVFIMPADDLFYMNDTDLGAIIAYLKTIPPVDNVIRPRNIKPLGKILYAIGAFGNQLKASAIADHSVRPYTPPVGVTAEYGQYLVQLNGCRTCHGKDLAGGKAPEPDAPPAPNLTPGGELAAWKAADLINTFRTGVTPGGHQLLDAMPWKEFQNRTDDEITAIFLYLQSLPKLDTVVPK
jgi:mono/diheme cytochrome c family protein